MRKFTLVGLLALVFASTLLSAQGGEFKRQRVTVSKPVNGYAFQYWDGIGEYIAVLSGVNTPEFEPNEKARRESLEWGVSLSDYLDYGYEALHRLIFLAQPMYEIDIEIVQDFGRIKGVYAYYVESEMKIDEMVGKCINDFLLKDGFAKVEVPRNGITVHSSPRFFEFYRMEFDACKKGIGYWGSIWKKLKEDFERGVRELEEKMEKEKSKP